MRMREKTRTYLNLLAPLRWAVRDSPHQESPGVAPHKAGGSRYGFTPGDFVPKDVIGLQAWSFTLVEMLISIAILTLILGSMLTVFSQGFRTVRKSKEKTVACALARGITEEYSDWDTLKFGGGSVSNGSYDVNDSFPDLQINPGNPRSPVVVNTIQYSCALDIADGPIPAHADKLKQVDTTITWVSRTRTQTVTFTTLKADY